MFCSKKFKGRNDLAASNKNKIACSLLAVVGMVGVSQGSSSQSFRKQVANISENLNREFLKSVQIGDVNTVKKYLQNPKLTFDYQDNNGNSDLMLAIKGGEKDEFDENYQTIFEFLIQKTNRNWNLQNNKGQTALLKAIGWKRSGCIKMLLQISEINPNIPNIEGITPLLGAIIVRNVEIILMLIGDSRVNVNQPGPDQKLPLQSIFEAKLPPLVINILCRRILKDYDEEVKKIIKTMMEQATLNIPGVKSKAQAEDIILRLIFMTQNVENVEVVKKIVQIYEELKIPEEDIIMMPQTSFITNLLLLYRDPKVNVNCYVKCPMNELIDAIQKKIHFILNKLKIEILSSPEEKRLQELSKKTKLFNCFLSDRNQDNNLKDIFQRTQDLQLLFENLP